MLESISTQHSDLISLDTAVDRWIHRPVSRVVALWLGHTSVTPNQVTVSSLVPAFTAAWLFGQGHAVYGMGGLVCFYLWAVLDNVDGDLARLKGVSSDFGKRLDDFCDNVASFVILFGIFAGLLRFLPEAELRNLYVYFAGGIMLNLVSGIGVLNAKRSVRETAVQKNQISRDFYENQKILDHFTGREPFYILVLLYLGASAFGGNWPAVLIWFMIGGCYVFSGFSFLWWFKMRFKSKSS